VVGSTAAHLPTSGSSQSESDAGLKVGENWQV